MSQNLAELKVVELRAELSKRGLPTTGNKAELVARLQQAVEAEKAKEEQEKAAQQSATAAAAQPAAARQAEGEQAQQQQGQGQGQQGQAQGGKKISLKSSAALTAEEVARRKAERAARFGLPVAMSEEEKKALRAARFGLSGTSSAVSAKLDSALSERPSKRQRTDTAPAANSKPKQQAKAGGAAQLSVEEQERLIKRAKKFGLPLPPGVLDPEELERRKARAQRFGLAAASS